MCLPRLSGKMLLNKESLRSISNPPHLFGQAHEIFDDEPSASEGVPARGSKTTKPSGCNTGQRLEKENRMLDAFFSLLGSLARAQIGLAETRHLPSAEATEEGPCKIVLSLERAQRPAQQ